MQGLCRGPGRVKDDLCEASVEGREGRVLCKVSVRGERVKVDLCKVSIRGGRVKGDVTLLVVNDIISKHIASPGEGRFPRPQPRPHTLTSQVLVILLLGVVIVEDLGVCVTVSCVIVRLTKLPTGKVNQQPF